MNIRKTRAAHSRHEATPFISLMPVVSSVVFALLLWKVVETFIAPNFGYYGYIPRSTTPWELVTCATIIVLLGALLPVRWTKPSDYSRGFLTATFGIPVVLVPTFWGPSDTPTLLTIHLVTFLVFALIKFLTSGPLWTTPRIDVSAPAFWTVVSVFVLFAIVYLFASTGISASFLSLNDVYSQRDEYASSIGGIGAYLVGWVGSGILPAMLVAGLYYRTRTLSIGAIVGILLLYSLTGYKSYLVGMALTLLGFVLCRQWLRRGYGWFLGLGIAVSFAAIVDHVTEGFALTSLLVRRALSTAGLNTSFFFDFFKQNDLYMLRHSILSFLGDSPSDLSPAKLIGLAYYGSEKTAANANLIADGYANFGVVGCLFMAVVLGLYLKLFDSASDHLPLQISAPALTLVLVALSNTAALTTMTTHGGIIALILVILMPPTGDLKATNSAAEVIQRSAPTRNRRSSLRANMSRAGQRKNKKGTR